MKENYKILFMVMALFLFGYSPLYAGTNDITLISYGNPPVTYAYGDLTPEPSMPAGAINMGNDVPFQVVSYTNDQAVSSSNSQATPDKGWTTFPGAEANNNKGNDSQPSYGIKMNIGSLNFMVNPTHRVNSRDYE